MTRSARDQIRRRKHEYCYALDAQDESAFLDLFAPDATLDISVFGTAQGTDELREFVAWFDDLGLASSAHLTANPIIDVDADAGRARGRWYYVVLLEAADGSLEVGHGRYDDEFVRRDGRWVFESLRADRLGAYSVGGQGPGVGE